MEKKVTISDDLPITSQYLNHGKTVLLRELAKAGLISEGDAKLWDKEATFKVGHPDGLESCVVIALILPREYKSN